MIPYYLEVKDSLFEDKEKNLLYIAMFNKKREFTAFAYTNLDNRAIVEPHMPFYMQVQRTNRKDMHYAKSSLTGMGLHDVVIGEKAPPGFQNDHENWNGLDNRRENLRTITCGGNGHNRIKQEGTSSQYFGVCLSAGKWKAQIKFGREHYNLGRFDTAEEAAKVHDIYAVHFYKDTARLNIKDGEYFLCAQEVKDIYEHGIPKQYKLKKRGEGRKYPECIGKQRNKYYYSKRYAGKDYWKSFDTQEEAEEGLRLLIEEKDEEIRKCKEEKENQIVRNDRGVAILYTHDINGKVNGEWRVNDEVWKTFIHNSWSQTWSNGKIYAQGAIDGFMASLHIHIWKQFKGPIPEDMTVDHIISEDTTDCTFENLRLATKSLQSHNTNQPKKTCGRFKCIGMDRGMFVVSFQGINFGRFYYEEDAIREYNRVTKEEYGNDAALIPEPGNTRTMVSDYFSNLSIEFLESLDTAQEIKELFYIKTNWGVTFGEISKENYKYYRDVTIKLRREEIENPAVEVEEEKEELPDFTLEYIRSIKTVKVLTQLFRERPDWKKRHTVFYHKIKVSTLEEYKLLAIQSKLEEIENLPVNDNFKPIISRINQNEEKIIKVGTTEDISKIQLPSVPDIAITPMKLLKLQQNSIDTSAVPKKLVLKIISVK
jgi:hypothetical protein